MAGKQNNSISANSRRRAPATDLGARENQMIALAIDAAERDLLSPNPSKQIVVHYLKLATVQAQLEKEKLQRENQLLAAKTDAIESQSRTEELYRDAINAMATYSAGFRQDSNID